MGILSVSNAELDIRARIQTLGVRMNELTVRINPLTDEMNWATKVGQSWPADVRAERSALIKEYNALVAKRNAERQALRNLRATVAVRQTACPVCGATHPGEC